MHMELVTVIIHWLAISVFCNQSAFGWRTFYISPRNSDSCPADHCYSLQDVINNQSYFFDSNTILELMPGRYIITEKVGHVAIDQVQNLLMTWSVVGQNVTIHCASNTTFGIMVIESSNVTITGIQIIHCSAEFKQLQVFDSMYTMWHKVHPYFQQWLNNSASCDSDHIIVPCIATIVSMIIQTSVCERSQYYTRDILVFFQLKTA